MPKTWWLNTFYGYDGTVRLKVVDPLDRHGRAGNRLGQRHLAGYQFTYDVASRITAINSKLDGNSEFDYDSTNQLVGADHNSQADEDYSFDENGNRAMDGYVIGYNNQLYTDGTYTYGYDDEGNRTSRTNIETGTSTEYAWDHHNRLVEVIELQSPTWNNTLGTQWGDAGGGQSLVGTSGQGTAWWWGPTEGSAWTDYITAPYTEREVDDGRVLRRDHRSPGRNRRRVQNRPPWHRPRSDHF